MPIVRGDSETWTITITDQANAPFPLVNCSVFVTYKSAANVEIPDSEALFQHWIEFNGSGVATAQDGMYVHPDGYLSGKIVERLDPDESAAFPVGDYVYDVQVIYPSPDVPGETDIETPIVGETDSVIADITRATATPGV